MKCCAFSIKSKVKDQLKRLKTRSVAVARHLFEINKQQPEDDKNKPSSSRLFTSKTISKKVSKTKKAPTVALSEVIDLTGDDDDGDQPAVVTPTSHPELKRKFEIIAEAYQMQESSAIVPMDIDSEVPRFPPGLVYDRKYRDVPSIIDADADDFSPTNEEEDDFDHDYGMPDDFEVSLVLSLTASLSSLSIDDIDHDVDMSVEMSDSASEDHSDDCASIDVEMDDGELEDGEIIEDDTSGYP
ncbi:hypothetical protein EIP91_003891, partial [Steccherinum ochraceum]